jgi:hypothetical protein
MPLGGPLWVVIGIGKPNSDQILRNGILVSVTHVRSSPIRAPPLAAAHLHPLLASAVTSLRLPVTAHRPPCLPPSPPAPFARHRYDSQAHREVHPTRCGRPTECGGGGTTARLTGPESP